MIVTLKPERGRTARMDKELHDKLQAYKAGLSKEEIAELVERTKALEISSIHLFLKKCKCVQFLDMHKRFIFIIEPAVHDLQTVHQTLRVTSVICFSVLELMIVNTCLQCFSVNAMLCHICKKLLDQCHKFFLLFRIRILRNYRKNWLIYAIVIRNR